LRVHGIDWCVNCPIATAHCDGTCLQKSLTLQKSLIPPGRNAVIKSLSLLTRKSTLSKEEFRRIWVSEHAPLVHAVPQVRRYVLSFILEEPTRPDVPTQAMNVDAVAELWYDDIAALKAAAASPEMKAVTDNGALHLGTIKSFITEEVAIIP
jgi:uncharacterized protein (TIGR02118 family)